MIIVIHYAKVGLLSQNLIAGAYLSVSLPRGNRKWLTEAGKIKLEKFHDRDVVRAIDRHEDWSSGSPVLTSPFQPKVVNFDKGMNLACHDLL